MFMQSAYTWKSSGSSFFFSLLCLILTLLILLVGLASDFDEGRIPRGPYDHAAMCFTLGMVMGSISVIFLVIGIMQNRSNTRVVLANTNQVQSPSQTHVNHHQQATPNRPQEQLAQIPRQVMKKCPICAEENPAGNTKCRLCASNF